MFIGGLSSNSIYLFEKIIEFILNLNPKKEIMIILNDTINNNFNQGLKNV